MTSHHLVLATIGLMLAACGSEPATDNAATSSATTPDMAATSVAGGAPGAVTAEGAAFAAADVMPGGAVDVLQREGWRVTPFNDTPA